MRQKKLGYPFSYGDELTLEIAREIARENRKKIYINCLVLITVSSSSLSGLSPIIQIGLPVFPVSIERLIQRENSDSQNKNRKNSVPIIKDIVGQLELTGPQAEKFKIVAEQFMLGKITRRDGILKLRGGDGIVDISVILGFILLINWLDGTYGFQSVPIPHIDSMGWLNGKHDRKPMSPITYKSSKFQLQMAGITDTMCPNPDMADENGFIMSYEESHNLVADTYSGYMQITEDLKITDWQGAKKAYHVKGLGINPEDYGITQKELNKIRDKGGLIGYVQRGGKLPPIELVRAYQTRIKEICYDPSTTKNDKATYTDVNGVRPVTVFSNKEGLNLISFDQITGDLITGDKQRLTYFENYVETNNIGTQKNNK
ncbi:MAG: hypothetical protein ACJA2M_002659 [Polaribacter sp.]|jgi:hypothetical protein